MWKKRHQTKSFRACTCTKLHNNHEGNLHHIPRKYWLKCMWALPLLRFSPFNNASALQKRTTRVTRAIDYWIYWQFVVVLVILVVSVATQTQNKSPSLSPLNALMWHLPMSARRQYMSTMRSEAAGSTQMYRPSSPRRLEVETWNPQWGFIPVGKPYIYDLYVFVLCPEYAKLIQVAVLEDLDHTSITSPKLGGEKA